MSALAQRSIAFQLSAVVAPAVGGLLFAIRPSSSTSSRSGSRSSRSGACSRCAAAASRRRKARRPRRGARRRSPHPPDNVLLGAISLDLFAVLFGGAVALLPIFAKDILEVGRPGSASCGRRRQSVRSSRRWSIARIRSGVSAGPKLFVVVAGFGVCMVAFGLSRRCGSRCSRSRRGGAFDMVSVVLRRRSSRS